MTLTVSTADVVAVSGKTQTTVLRWTADVPKVSPPGARAHLYNIAHILPRLSSEQAAALIERAQDDGSLWVGGDDMLPVAERLCAWIAQHPEMVTRLHAVRVSFFNALASTVRTGLLVSDTERLRVLLVLAPALLDFIVTGEKRGLPDFSRYAQAFAVVHTAAPYESELLSAA